MPPVHLLVEQRTGFIELPHAPICAVMSARMLVRCVQGRCARMSAMMMVRRGNDDWRMNHTGKFDIGILACIVYTLNGT